MGGIIVFDALPNHARVCRSRMVSCLTRVDYAAIKTWTVV